MLKLLVGTERIDVMEIIMEAVQLMENNDTESAITLLENYAPSATDEEKFMIAEFYMQWGFYSEATGLLEDLLRQYPEESDIKMLLADIFIELEEDKEAIDLLTSISEDDPAYLQALLQLADLYQSEGLFEVAESKLLEAKNIQPDEPIIDFALGEFFFSTGEYQRAIIHYEKLPDHMTEIAHVSITSRLAESYTAQGAYEKALEYYQTLNSDQPDTLFKHGLAAYYAKRKDIAINVWKKVIELDGYYHTVYYELAKAYDEEGYVKEAFETCQKGLELDEHNKELFFLAGQIANKLDKHDLSEKYMLEAVAIDFDYKAAVIFLINIWKHADEHERIIEFLSQIKEQGAQDPLYDWEMARAFNEEEAYPEALEAYRQAYEPLQQDSEFLKEYGYFLVEDGKIKQAIPIFETYTQIETLDTDTVEYVERLKQSINTD